MPKARLVFDGDNVYIGKDARIYGLKDDIASKIDGIPGVVDSLDSTSATDALSANMGRTLQDQINGLSGTGKFLSTWDCTTGLPGTNPQEDPYTYKVGDYYVVSTVGATNYKPHGGTYTQGVPSTTVETENVGINDKYYFDGADWVRIPNTAIQIIIDTALSTSSTNAVENRAIANAVNAKQDIISDLSTIRAGASKGAIAIQPNDNISQLTNNVGYQTAGDVASAIAGKQDILSAGDGISISNNTVINTKPGTAVSNTAPSNPTEGMLWYDTINHVLKIYNGVDWETVDTDSDTTYTAGNGINISAQNEISVDTSVIATKQYVDDSVADVIPSGSTAPANPQEGDLWYDTVNHVLKIYNGTSWETVDTDTNTTYTAGNGINIDVNNEISVDTTIIPTQADLAGKQDVLTAGDNIQISAQNVISATDTTYTAGEGIAILNGNDYSAMRGPCPGGFHIPTKDELQSLKDMGVTLNAWTATAGNNFVLYFKVPKSGYLRCTDGSIGAAGSSAYLRSSEAYNNKYSYALAVISSGFPVSNNGVKADGYHIRPFKDGPVIPDNNWTTVYDGSSVAVGAGIFYSATLGLTSISSDGINWITVADKNLGATVVRNDGDALTEANCGKFYQWGNNYGFPYTGATTTSSTLVDASNYGPGNYYSSSTFITTNGSSVLNWDSSNNDNLWGRTTGVAQLNNAITNIGVTSVNGQVGDVIVDTGVPAGSTPPANPVQGQLWYDTVNGKLFVYDGTNWVEISTISGVISGTTFGTFAKACLASGSVHTTQLNKYYKSSGSQIISDRGTATYTMQGIGFFTGMGWSANSGTVSIVVNGLTIWSENNSVGTYSMKYLNTPITLSAGDEVSVTMSQSGSGDVYANISDFY